MSVPQEVIDALPYPSRLKSLVVKTPFYDASIRPSNGFLLATYMGANIKLSVIGADINASIVTGEGCIWEYHNEQVAPGSLTWQEIWQDIICHLLQALANLSKNQKEYLREVGRYYEH